MFPKRLKQLRNIKKDSQQTMADFLGITRQGYGKYENGGSEPSFEMLQRIADYFKVSTDYLIGRTDNFKTEINEAVASREGTLTADEKFEAFANNPDLEFWYKDLPNYKEKDLVALKQMWEIIIKNWK